MISLQEPEKAQVFKEAELVEPIKRQAFVTLYEKETNSVYESVVELWPEERVVSRVHVPGVQAMISLEEFVACETVVKESKEFQDAIKRHYDIDDMSDVQVDPWSAGYYGEESESSRRLSRPLCFFCDPETRFSYARPIEGIRPVVDLNEMRVIRVEEHEKVPLPPIHQCAYEASHIPNLRSDVKPLEIVQSEGPSFKVEDHKISWQNWSFVIGYNQREALTLHDLRYYDQSQNRHRPIMYRGSLVEMVVPYGDPRETQARKNAFDVGEYGIGHFVGSLNLGCDCLGTIKYFDANMTRANGEIVTIENAICLHEEDYGISWKHLDRHTNTDEVRRSRRLVISCIAAGVGNYDYGFYWYLYQG